MKTATRAPAASCRRLDGVTGVDADWLLNARRTSPRAGVSAPAYFATPDLPFRRSPISTTPIGVATPWGQQRQAIDHDVHVFQVVRRRLQDAAADAAAILLRPRLQQPLGRSWLHVVPGSVPSDHVRCGTTSAMVAWRKNRNCHWRNQGGVSRQYWSAPASYRVI